MKLWWVVIICCLVSTGPVFGFAAKKSGSQKTKQSKSSSSSFRGFGTAPPTFQEILASFPTRMLLENAKSLPCPCQSSSLLSSDNSKPYGECCSVYHDSNNNNNSNDAWPPTPLDVLKSRYSAFFFRNIGYIIDTTHETCRDYQQDKIAWAKSLDRNGMFDSYNFSGLTILGQDQGGEPSDNDDDDKEEEEAFIEFKVQLQSKETKEMTTIQERSQFIKNQDGKWKYASGTVRSMVQGMEDIVLNP